MSLAGTAYATVLNSAGSRVVASTKSNKLYPRLLICEGYEDYCFFSRLIDEWKIQRFHILHAGGNGHFYGHINSFKVSNTTTFNQIKHFLFVSDNDDDCQGRFMLLSKQIEKIFGTGTAPDAPRTPKGTDPSIQVLMIPWDNKHRNLETLCVKPGWHADKRGGTLVRDCEAIIKADQWASESRRWKAWLRINLAIRCERDPFISMGDAISDKHHKRLIDFSHRSLSPIAEYLNRVGH